MSLAVCGIYYFQFQRATLADFDILKSAFPNFKELGTKQILDISQFQRATHEPQHFPISQLATKQILKGSLASQVSISQFQRAR